MADEVVELADEAGLAAAVQRLFEAWRRSGEHVATADALWPFTRVTTAEAVAGALDLALGQRRR